MFLGKTLQLYLANTKVAVVFGVLLVFVALFMQFGNVFASSGSMFYNYTFSGLGILGIAAEAIALIIFLALYAAFVSIVVFSVRSEMSHVRIHYYIQEMLEKFALRLFTFYLALIFGLAIVGFLLVSAGVSVIAVNVLLLIITLAFLFVPQAIVIDEKGLRMAFYHNFEFIAKNIPAAIMVVVVSAALLLVIPMIELFFDSYGFIGSIVSILIVLLFAVPFIETLKTQLYMLKFKMVRAHHYFEIRNKI